MRSLSSAIGCLCQIHHARRRAAPLVSIADLPLDSLADIWPALRASSAVTWAQASWPAVKSQFHIRAVPTVLVYDRNRRLAKGFVGEVRVDSVYALATK